MVDLLLSAGPVITFYMDDIFLIVSNDVKTRCFWTTGNMQWKVDSWTAQEGTDT